MVFIFVFAGLVFGRRYYDPEVGIWLSVDPENQFHNSYSYGANNPVNTIDPDGALVWAVQGDRQTYANFTQQLTPEQAYRLNAMEKDPNVVFQFVAGSKPVLHNGQVLDGFVLPTEDKGVIMFVNVKATEFSALKVFVHEVAGHGKQILDLFNKGLNTEQVINAVETNRLEFEKEAWKLQGDPKTIPELKEMGY